MIAGSYQSASADEGQNGCANHDTGVDKPEHRDERIPTKDEQYHQQKPQNIQPDADSIADFVHVPVSV